MALGNYRGVLSLVLRMREVYYNSVFVLSDTLIPFALERGS